MPGSEVADVPCPLCGSTAHKPERTLDGYALVRCRGCALVYMNPQPSADAVEEIYVERDTERVIAFYAHSHTPAVRRYYAEKLAGLERRLPGKGRLLDFGCAAGYFTEAAANRGWDAVGVDLGRWTADAAARRGFHGIRVGPLEDLGFLPGSFDAVNASQVFEHLPDPRGLLRTLVGLLRPGGLLAADVPNYRTLPILLGKDDFASNRPPQHLNYFAPATLARLLRAGGLTVEAVGSGGGLKWENLLSRPITSDVLGAHAAAREGKPVPAEPMNAPPPPGILARAKRFVGRRIARPILYGGFKWGMRLDAIGRK
jgi:2-polyprenyl-3-methyl-5-hydroxy-6-metoxy-1,4-benzoquinol methylase